MEEDPLIASTIKAEPPTIIILSVVRDERSCVPFHVVSTSVRLLVDSHRPHAKSRQTSPLGSNIISLHQLTQDWLSSFTAPLKKRV